MKIAAMFAEGFEEVEALAVVDLLRRAKVEVDMISIYDKTSVMGAHNIEINAEKIIDEVDFSDYDGIFLPGGMPGTNNLEANKKLCHEIISFNEQKKLLAAICAAPKIFGGLGILKGKKAICYPGYEKDLEGAEVIRGAKVVKDGHIYTSRGMGTAIDLGLELIKNIVGENEAEKLAEGIQYT